MSIILSFIYLLSFDSIAIPSIPSFRVCGSYCGPGWCNDKWISEAKCDESTKPEYHFLTGYSCADLCCQKHDKCCGNQKNEQGDCNPKIVECLSQCNPLSLTCTNEGIPILAGEIEAAMDIVKGWCCGTPCPK